MTDDLKQAARDLIALDAERTPGEWFIEDEPERAMQLIAYRDPMRKGLDGPFTLGAVWTGGQRVVFPNAAFIAHNANHAPSIARAYLDQCEANERLREALVRMTNAADAVLPSQNGNDLDDCIEYNAAIEHARKELGDTDV